MRGHPGTVRMTQPGAGDPGNLPEAKLPPRDWILLPILSVLTIVLMAVTTESIARRAFSESKTSLKDCLVLNDATTGVRGVPNSVCWEKIPESPLIEYRMDCSGYRSGMACGPKPPGTCRIVMMGSSVAMGERVPIENTFATLLPKELSPRSGRKVELYNEAIGYGFPRNTALRFNDVLAAKPDLILWTLTLIDVKLAGFLYPENPSKKPDHPLSSSPGPIDSLKSSMKETLREHAANPIAASLIALRHFVYQHESQDQYIESYLMLPNGAEGFWDAGPRALSSELSPEWQAHLNEFEHRAVDIQKMAKNAGVPLVAVLLPNRAQAAMISEGEWPPGFDPFKLDNELHRIITSHGGIYIDILPDFRAMPNAERHYYPLDGHPDAAGHAIIAEFLAKELSSGSVPELSAAVEPHAALEAGK
jgi:hypothetical protein